MDSGTLATEFLELLRKFRSSVDKEIESLERSSQDMNVLVKSVNEVSSLLGKEGLSFFVGELKKMLETIKIAEKSSTSTKQNGTTNEMDAGTLEIKKINVDNKIMEPMDVDNIEIKRNDIEKKEENIHAITKDDMLKCKTEWPLQHAELLSDILQLIMPFLPSDRDMGLMYRLNELRPCSHTKTLADTLHVLRYNNTATKEIKFYCYENRYCTIKANMDVHTDVVRRIYERMLSFITRHSKPQQQPHILENTWKRFTIIVNSEGESLMDIRAFFTETNIESIKMKLIEEFNSPEAKDCNLRTVILTHANNQTNSYTLFGTSNIVEKMFNMTFTLDASYLCLWNQVAIKTLSESLLKLANLNRNQTGVLFIDVMSAVPVLYMAKACRKIVLLHKEDQIRKFITSEAAKNSILNFSSSMSPLQQILSKDFNQCQEVSLVISDMMALKCKDVSVICQSEKVTKVIFLSNLEEISHMKRLVMFCNHSVKDSFVITQAVPIDMSPFELNVQMLFLLERLTQLHGRVIPNPNFSAKTSSDLKNVNESGLYVKGKRTLADVLKNLSTQLKLVQDISRMTLSKTSNLSGVTEEKKPPVANKGPDQNVSVASKETVQNSKQKKEKIDSQSEAVKLEAVSSADQVFLDVLNESQKKIMTQIISELDNCKFNLNEEYNSAITFKKELVNFEAKTLSDTLIPVLPHLVSTASSGLAFQQLHMNVCPSVATPCEKYHIILERNSPTGKIVNTLNSDNELIPLRRTLSNKAKNICKLVASFIVKSEYPMFGLQTKGFWRGMTIRINSKGEPWLMIEAGVDTIERAKIILSDLADKLKLFFKSGLRSYKAPDLKDVVLSILTKTSTESRVVFGDNMVCEKVGAFTVKIHGKRFPYYNPFGMMGLAQEILKLAAVDKKWGIVQVGCGCGIESLQLANNCGELHLLRQPGVLNIFFLVKENGIKNFVYKPVSDTQAMETALVKDMARYSNICVLYDLSESVGFFGASILRNTSQVKKIIYIINTSNTDWIKELVACCQIRTDWKEPFVITKFTSVDMAPCEDNVKIICLLERESSVQADVRINSAFSQNAVAKLLSGQMQVTEDVSLTSKENTSVQSAKMSEDKNCEKPKNVPENKLFQKEVNSPIKQLASVQANLHPFPHNDNQPSPNDKIKQPFFRENTGQPFQKNLFANNLAQSQISTAVRPGPQINQKQWSKSNISTETFYKDDVRRDETSMSVGSRNTIQRDTAASSDVDYLRPVSNYSVTDFERRVRSQQNNFNDHVIDKNRSYSPSRMNVQSEIPSLWDERLQNSSGINFQSDIPSETNYRSRSSLETDYRPRSPLRTKYRPRSPLRTEYRPRSPLRTEYRPRSPLRNAYRPRSPLRTAYRPHSPLRTAYRPRSPLETDYRSRSPLGTDYRSRSPLTVDYRSKNPQGVRGQSPLRARAPSPLRTRAPSPLRARAPSPLRARAPSPLRTRAPSPLRTRAPSPLRTRAPSPQAIRGRSPQGIRARSPLGITMPSPQEINYRYHSSQEMDYRSRNPQIIDYRSGVPERINYRSYSPVEDNYSRSHSSSTRDYRGHEEWETDYRSADPVMTDHRSRSPGRSTFRSESALPISYDRHSPERSYKTFNYSSDDRYAPRNKNFQGSNYY